MLLSNKGKLKQCKLENKKEKIHEKETRGENLEEGVLRDTYDGLKSTYLRDSWINATSDSNPWFFQTDPADNNLCALCF